MAYAVVEFDCKTHGDPSGRDPPAVCKGPGGTAPPFPERMSGTPSSISGCFPLTLPAGGLVAFWFHLRLDSRSGSIKYPTPTPKTERGFLSDPVVPRCVLLCRR